MFFKARKHAASFDGNDGQTKTPQWSIQNESLTYLVVQSKWSYRVLYWYAVAFRTCHVLSARFCPVAFSISIRLHSAVNHLHASLDIKSIFMLFAIISRSNFIRRKSFQDCWKMPFNIFHTVSQHQTSVVSLAWSFDLHASCWN